jgi:ribosome-associated toxin RatA of RatAB toxin-antitoxin module
VEDIKKYPQFLGYCSFPKMDKEKKIDINLIKEHTFV